MAAGFLASWLTKHESQKSRGVENDHECPALIVAVLHARLGTAGRNKLVSPFHICAELTEQSLQVAHLVEFYLHIPM